MVKNGGQLTEGAISPKKLLEVADVTAVENYILKEVQKFIVLNRSAFDKHIEVIVRQMLRKVLVVEAGDTNLLAVHALTLILSLPKHRCDYGRKHLPSSLTHPRYY